MSIDYEKLFIPSLGLGFSIFLGALYKKVTGKKHGKPAMPKLVKHPIKYQLVVMKSAVESDFHVSEMASDYQVKEAAFRDIMFNMLEIHENELGRLRNKVICVGDCDRCKEKSYLLNIKSFDHCMKSYKSYYQSDLYTLEEQKVLSICLEKFNQLYREYAGNINATIKKQHTSPFFNSCVLNINNMIQNSYQQAFVDIYSAVLDSIEALNGDLKGLEFRARDYGRRL